MVATSNNIVCLDTYRETRQWDTFTDRVKQVLTGVGLPDSPGDVTTMILLLLHQVDKKTNSVYLDTLEKLLPKERAEEYIKLEAVKEATSILLSEWDNNEESDME